MLQCAIGVKGRKVQPITSVLPHCSLRWQLLSLPCSSPTPSLICHITSQAMVLADMVVVMLRSHS